MILKVRSVFFNAVVKNASWLIVGKVIQMLISLLVGILTARYLGPSNYGLINYANAYVAFFASLCTLGINSVIVKEFVDSPQNDGQIIGTALGLRAVSSCCSAVMIVGISSVLDAGEPVTQLVVLLCSLGAVFHIFETFNYWFQAKLRAKRVAIAALIAYTVAAVYKVILLVLNKPVFYFALASSIDYICIAAILFYFYVKDGGNRLSFSWEYGKQLLRKSYHYILPGMMVAIYGQTDKLMLKQLYNEAETGYYATATTLCSMWCFVLSAIIDSLNPIIMQAHRENEEKFKRFNRILYCIVFYVSVVVSLMFVLFGDVAIRILYGENYLPASAPLKVITWYTAFSYLGVARNAWIVCENKQKYLKHIYVIAAVSNVLLNVIFIPYFGAVGAAIASLIAQIVTVMIAPLFIKEVRENSVLMIEAIFFKGLNRKRML